MGQITKKMWWVLGKKKQHRILWTRYKWRQDGRDLLAWFNTYRTERRYIIELSPYLKGFLKSYLATLKKMEYYSYLLTGNVSSSLTHIEITSFLYESYSDRFNKEFDDDGPHRGDDKNYEGKDDREGCN